MFIRVILITHLLPIPKQVLIRVWVYRRMVSIRDLKLTMVVVLVLLALPVRLDGWEGCAAVSAGVAIRHWLRCPCLAVEDAGIAVVEVHVGEWRPNIPLA